MKHKKTILLFVVISAIVFALSANFWYKETNEMYEYNNFKNSLIEEIVEDPTHFKEYYNIETKEQLTPQIIDDIYSKSKVRRYIFIILASLPITFFSSILIFSPIFIIMSIVKKYKKYRLSIDDFKKNNGYYRDLLKDYNPLELSYNNNYSLDDNALIAMILYLQKKNVLYLKGNSYYVNGDNLNGLTNIEKEFVDCVTNSKGKQIEVSRVNITNIVNKSCYDKKLLDIGDIPKQKIIFDIIKAIICYVVLFIAWTNINSILNLLPKVENVFFVFTIFGILIILLLFIIFYPFVIFFKYSLLFFLIKIKHSKRSDLGNEINNKLEGLKNFIRDFTLLDERSKEELFIWDDYLIYSALFGNNAKIYDEMKNKVKFTL